MTRDTIDPVVPARYPLVDALRGASIVLVILLHLQLRVPLEHGLLFLLVLGVLHHLHVPGFTIDPAIAPLLLVVLALEPVQVQRQRRGERAPVGRLHLPPAWDVLWSLSVEEAFYLFFPIATVLAASSALGAASSGHLVALQPLVTRAGPRRAPWSQPSRVQLQDRSADRLQA
jgi:peptidoglycan/LPS O-acetylase OafA/YrhL